MVCAVSAGCTANGRFHQAAGMAERLGSVEDFAAKAEAETLRQAFMQQVNSSQATPHPSMRLAEFVEQLYLPWVKSELRASTHKGYREIWNLYLAGRVGPIRLRQFRTVDASRMLRTIAEDCDLTKTTLQHIKSVLSGIFTHAKNEGAYDGENPVHGARIPRNAREPGETYAYNLVQILRILDLLPLLPKAVVATASFAGLREGELCGVEWPDFAGDALTVNRSVWKTIVNEPKTRASRQSVPVIPTLTKLLDEYRASMHNPRTGVMFHQGNGERMDMDKPRTARDPSGS